MKYRFQFGSEVASLPAAALREKLASCTEPELKLLCGLACDPSLAGDYESNADAFAAAIGCRRGDLDRALEFWRGAGAVAPDGETPRKKTARSSSASKPHYTGEELADIIETEGIAGLIDECSAVLGRTFNPTDVNSIAAMHHHLGVDGAYILLLCDYCVRLDKRSIAYVTKLAYNLYDEGVDSTSKLEAYIAGRDALAAMESKLRRMFGIDSRALTSKEKACFEQWTVWECPEDMIRKAYEIAVEKTGKYTISYIDKVIQNWHMAGYRTAEDVEEAQKRYAEAKAGEGAGSFDTDEFFEAALRRTRENVLKTAKTEK